MVSNRRDARAVLARLFQGAVGPVLATVNTGNTERRRAFLNINYRIMPHAKTGVPLCDQLTSRGALAVRHERFAQPLLQRNDAVVQRLAVRAESLRRGWRGAGRQGAGPRAQRRKGLARRRRSRHRVGAEAARHRGALGRGWRRGTGRRQADARRAGGRGGARGRLGGRRRRVAARRRGGGLRRGAVGRTRARRRLRGGAGLRGDIGEI